MKRILLVTDKYLPQRGGSQVVFHHLYEGIHTDDGLVVTVVTRSSPGDASFDDGSRLRVHRLPFHDIPKLRMPWLWFDLWRAASRMVSAGGITEVHAGQCPETASIARWISRRYGLPYLVHTFGEELQCYSRRHATRALLQRTLCEAYAVTANSRFTRGRLLALGVDATRVHVIYGGVRVGEPPVGAAQALRVHLDATDGPLLLTVGRLTRRKGVDCVLRALPGIAEHHPRLVYVVVGTGPEESHLRRLAIQIGVADRVRFVGTVAPADLASFYAACDLFVLANRELPNGDVEGFGLVFLEANAQGKAAVGGRSGGTADAVVENTTGILVDPEDTHALAISISGLLSDPDRRAWLGRHGRERVRTQFVWERSVTQFREVIGRHR